MLEIIVIEAPLERERVKSTEQREGERQLDDDSGFDGGDDDDGLG